MAKRSITALPETGEREQVGHMDLFHPLPRPSINDLVFSSGGGRVSSGRPVRAHLVAAGVLLLAGAAAI